MKVDEEEIATFLPAIYRKLDWLDKDDLIKRVVSLEFNRFWIIIRTPLKLNSRRPVTKNGVKGRFPERG